MANWDGAANDSVYDVTVWDESGVAVASGQVIGAEAPCMSAYTIAFDRIVPEQTQTYTIEVTLRNPDCVIRTDFLYYQSAWDLYADGALYAPEEVENVDLALLCMRKIKGKLESKTPCIYVCFMLGLDLI